MYAEAGMDIMSRVGEISRRGTGRLKRTKKCVQVEVTFKKETGD